jgi:hypothetical protein
MTRGLVQTSGLLRRCDSAPRGASRPFLGHSAKMPRIRFYNRRFASRAPATNTTFGDCPPRAVGKPAGVRHRDRDPESGVSAVRPRTALDHLAVIQPPTAPCLTARRRLRVDRLPRLALARTVAEERRGLVSRRQLRRVEPSDTSCREAEKGRVNAPASSPAGPARTELHVNAAGLARTREVPSAGEDRRERSCEHPRGGLPPLAGGGNRRTSSSVFITNAD